MKKLTALLFAFVAFSLTSISASAENTTGNVSLWAYSNSSEMTITAEFNWWNNDSGNYIQTFLYWDTIPNMYRFVDSSTWGLKHYEKDGSVSFVMYQYVPCKIYRYKMVGVDGKSGKQFIIYRSTETSGNTKPAITLLNFNQIGFNFAEISVQIANFCNWASYEIKVNELGKSPFIVKTGDAWEQVIESLYGLESNKEYTLSFRLFNSLGETTVTYGFRTMSNLPPVVQSNWVTKISNNSLVISATLDPKNTWSAYAHAKIGESLDVMNEQTERQLVDIKGIYTFPVGNRKPNTVYFAQVSMENDFGDHAGHPVMFKTNEFATAVTEITSDDLLQVSSCPAGIRIYPEKDAIVEIYSITGQKVLTTNLRGGEAHIFSSLTPGVYIVKSFIEGYTVTKKSIVN